MAKVEPRNEMPRQDPKVRAHNFDEVALGYSHEQAVAEANRCLQCKKPACVDGCPVQVRIPEFIKALRDDEMWESVTALKDKNNLPAICGRVCPQETQCEEKCVLGKKFEPVAIGRLERYVSDWEIGQGVRTPERAPSTGKRVAVIGAGPAGLTCAGDLAKMGHEVTMFEALHAPGGVLIYGIPEFRLPKFIVATEVKYVQSLGVDLRLNQVVGKLSTVDELLADGYDAIFLGTGAGLPMFMNIPGENFNGVYSANEFLT
ncbi:MAG: dihydropyrimidine dehydrogenase, partial [Chloroflexi bacterium]|nr:dihydropyrimidine dehydrogenase [Chloroflexota bacterium]